jgi:enoyl-CoA hydratase/carnithine racemase
VTVIESDAGASSVEDLVDLVPANEVVAIVCHGIIDGATDAALSSTQIVLGLDGQLVDGALSVAAQSLLILASDRGSFLDLGREAGESYGVVLQARLPMGEVARMSLTAQPLAAADAERVGLVDRLVATEVLRQEAIDAAHLMADISST